MRYAVINAGGAGTRLWPMSRTMRPKPLLPFIASEGGGGKSLLRLAAERVRNLVPPTCLYICTGAAYTQAVLADLPGLPTHQVLPEPIGRDTANAVAFSAAILHKHDPEAILAVLTADHIIEPVSAFEQSLRTAFEAVEKHPEYLITFGITPSYPATGYGYLHQGAQLPDLPGVHKVQAFKEKPKLAQAEHYVKDGHYFWNSGAFVWKAATVLEQLKAHLPESYEGVMKIAKAWDTQKQSDVLAKVYPTLPKISIDFAVMEKAPHVAMVTMPVQWLDVGSWTSLAETLTPDAHGNRTSGALVEHLDSTNTLAVSEVPGHLIATINTHDLIIVHTPRATLVCPAKDAQRVKDMVAAVEKNHGKDLV